MAQQRPAARRRRSRTPAPRRRASERGADAGAEPQLLFELLKGAGGAQKPIVKRAFTEPARASTLARKVAGASRVAQQGALLVLVYVSFLTHERRGWDDARLATSAGTAFAGMVALLAVARRLDARASARLPRADQTALGGLLVVTFSPVLCTLTKLYDSDTVFTLAGCCGVLHLYLYDYFPRGDDMLSTTIDCTVSQNAAFVMSLVLASRLETIERVATFLMSAILLLVLVPRVVLSARRHWRTEADFPLSLLAMASSAAAYQGLVAFEDSLATWFLLWLALVLIAAPIVHGVLFRYKEVIRGPWDVVDVVPLSDEDEI